MSTTSGDPESWIASFCSLLGHEYFAEVSEDFIEDDFNLTGLQAQVPMYKEALEMILDVEPEDEDDEEEEEEEEEEEDISGDAGHEGIGMRTHGGGVGGGGDRRHHSRIASDLSVIESSAEMLYGLIHQRFICSRAGIQQMSEKYELGHFGVCPRTNCNQSRTLPVGLSDVIGEDTVKLFCPSCLDVYVPPNSRFQTVDGAFFGRTFGALFLLTFPEYDLAKSGAESLSSIGRGGGGPSASGSFGLEDPQYQMINGVYACNIAPGLGRSKIYEPRIYGFRVSEMARSGPRMQWLRDKPDDVTELDEARHFAEEGGGESEEDAASGMNINGGGAGSGRSGALRRQPAGTARLNAQQRQRQNQNGSPMAVETNGVESEL